MVYVYMLFLFIFLILKNESIYYVDLNSWLFCKSVDEVFFVCFCSV